MNFEQVFLSGYIISCYRRTVNPIRRPERHRRSSWPWQFYFSFWRGDFPGRMSMKSRHRMNIGYTPVAFSAASTLYKYCQPLSDFSAFLSYVRDHDWTPWFPQEQRAICRKFRRWWFPRHAAYSAFDCRYGWKVLEQPPMNWHFVHLPVTCMDARIECDFNCSYRSCRH